MPIFEFKCNTCKTTLEKILTQSESEKKQTCPACGTHMYKIMSLSNFSLKGDGWYKPAATNPNKTTKEA